MYIKDNITNTILDVYSYIKLLEYSAGRTGFELQFENLVKRKRYEKYPYCIFHFLKSDEEFMNSVFEM